MFQFFNQEVKNTRFWLALIIMLMMSSVLFMAVALVMWAAYTGKSLDTALVAIVSSVAGAIVAQGATVVNSYFKDQAEKEKAEAYAAQEM
jgi:uncharacterized membrane protein